MSWTDTRAYGPCNCGSGRFVDSRVEVRMTVDERDITLTDVSQGRCPACGTRVYRPDLLERIERLMNSGSPSSGRP